jgi:hypothetical protein
MRHLLRTIVLSSTYSQTSAQTARHRDLDPENVWLARGPAFRLTGEQLRDQALAVSGLLSRKVGGPSVMPPQPGGVWRQLYSGARWTDASGEDRYRRALYTFWRRTSPHPAMMVFDAQSREACVLRRQRTNTPLQALVLLNDPIQVEAARALATRTLREGGADRLAWMFAEVLQRAPTAPELLVLRGQLEKLRRQYEADVEAARALVAVGEQPVPDDVRPSQLAAWTGVARVVLSLHETLTRS